MNSKIKQLGVGVCLLSSIILADTAGDIESAMASRDVAGNYASNAKEVKLTALKTLKQSLNFGSSNTSGNSKTFNINGKYNASFSTLGLVSKVLKVKFDVSGFMTKNNEVRDNEEYASNLGLEQLIVNGWLGYTSVSWLKNNFKNFNNKVAIGVGVGKELFTTSKQSLTFKLGVAQNIERYTKPADIAGELLDSRAFGSLNEYVEYHYTFNPTSKFFLKLGASENFEDVTKDYDILASLGFNFSVAENINLALEEEISFDNIPAGERKTDTKTIIRVGYNF